MTPAPMGDRPRVNPHLALASGILAVSTGAIFARLAASPALVTAAYRVGIATLVLLPIAAWKIRGELKKLTAADLRLGLLAGGCLALHFAAWISSLDHTGIANSVVLVNTHPIWVGVLTPWIGGERLGKTAATGIGLSVTGAAMVGFEDFSIAGGAALQGDLMALAGGLFAAFYLLLGRKIRRRLSLLAYVTLCYGSAAVMLWTAVLSLGLPVSGFDNTTWAALAGMALVSQLIGHSSYNWALKWFSAGLIAVSLLGEPIGAGLLAFVIFGETLTVVQVVGCGVILAAICIAASGEKGVGG